ncbi:MAG TPA: hypothetical protein VGO34_11640 [Alphaproteobacteria bacterium]|jgi:hypothetical protein
MPGISYLRPQYTNLGSATRLAGGARQVAHETDLDQIAALGEGRSNGGQEEALLQEVVPRTAADQQGGQERQDNKEPPQPPRPLGAPQAPLGRDANGGDFHVDPHLPPIERMAATGLVVAAPLLMSERLMAAEQAYGYSRDVLNGGQTKLGEGFDSAS